MLAASYVWKRAKRKGCDDDPERARKLARIRAVIERLRLSDAFYWVDELDIHLLAKVGYQWMLEGMQNEVPTPGQNEKQFLAGALRPFEPSELTLIVDGRTAEVWSRKNACLRDDPD